MGAGRLGPCHLGQTFFSGHSHPHFADEDTEAQRGEGTSPRPQSSKRQSRTCTLPTVTLIVSVLPQEFRVFKFPFFSCSGSFFLVVLFSLRDSLPLLVPRLRIKPSPSAVKAQSSSHWTARECPHSGSYARCPFKRVTCIDSLNHAFRGEVELSRAHLGGEGPGLGRTVAEAGPVFLLRPRPYALLQGVGVGAGGGLDSQYWGSEATGPGCNSAGLAPPVGPFRAECNPPAPRLKLGGNPPG